MRKTRSEALWNELTANQLETLDGWLFDRKLSYAKVLPMAKAQLGFKGSVSSLKRYHKHRQQERMLTDMGEVVKDAAKVKETGMEKKALRSANMNLFHGYLFQALRACPEKIKELAPLYRVAVQDDHNDALREIKDEEHQIRRELMAFAKERHQFALMETALKALPQLKELAEAKKDPHTKRYEENAYWNRVRHAMFGMGIAVQPESAEEEAELAAARKAREERQQRERAAEENVVEDVQPPAPSSPHYDGYIQAQGKWDLENWEMGAEYVI